MQSRANATAIVCHAHAHVDVRMCLIPELTSNIKRCMEKPNKESIIISFEIIKLIIWIIISHSAVTYVCIWFPNFLPSRIIASCSVHLRLALLFIYLTMEINENWIFIIVKENPKNYTRQHTSIQIHIYARIHVHALVTFLFCHIYTIHSRLIGSFVGDQLEPVGTHRHICCAISNRIFSFLIVVIVFNICTKLNFIHWLLCVRCRIFVSIQYYVIPNMKLKKLTKY